jgi:hypothetical protein
MASRFALLANGSDSETETPTFTIKPKPETTFMTASITGTRSTDNDGWQSVKPKRKFTKKPRKYGGKGKGYKPKPTKQENEKMRQENIDEENRRLTLVNNIHKHKFVERTVTTDDNRTIIFHGPNPKFKDSENDIATLIYLFEKEQYIRDILIQGFKETAINRMDKNGDPIIKKDGTPLIFKSKQLEYNGVAAPTEITINMYYYHPDGDHDGVLGFLYKKNHNKPGKIAEAVDEILDIFKSIKEDHASDYQDKSESECEDESELECEDESKLEGEDESKLEPVATASFIDPTVYGKSWADDDWSPGQPSSDWY